MDGMVNVVKFDGWMCNRCVRDGDVGKVGSGKLCGNGRIYTKV